MGEECIPAGAEIIEAVFAVGGGGETILGTLAVTGKADPAIQALLGQRSELVLAKLVLPVGGDQFDDL